MTASPRLVYCSISAYGDRGPKSHLPGYDPILQADSGIMDVTGYPGQPAARLGIGAIDLGTALWAAIGIQAALAQRDAISHATQDGVTRQQELDGLAVYEKASAPVVPRHYGQVLGFFNGLTLISPRPGQHPPVAVQATVKTCADLRRCRPERTAAAMTGGTMTMPGISPAQLDAMRDTADVIFEVLLGTG